VTGREACWIGVVKGFLASADPPSAEAICEQADRYLREFDRRFPVTDPIDAAVLADRIARGLRLMDRMHQTYIRGSTARAISAVLQGRVPDLSEFEGIEG